MKLYSLNTKQEKLDFLLHLRDALRIAVATNCFVLQIDLAEINEESFNSEDFKTVHQFTDTQMEWMTFNTIMRDMEKLIKVNNKIQEIEND